MNVLQAIVTLLGGLGVVVAGGAVLAIGMQARRCRIPYWRPIAYSAGFYALAFFVKPPPALENLAGWQPVETLDSVRVVLLAVLLTFTARSIIEDHKKKEIK